MKNILLFFFDVTVVLIIKYHTMLWQLVTRGQLANVQPKTQRYRVMHQRLSPQPLHLARC